MLFFALILTSCTNDFSHSFINKKNANAYDVDIVCKEKSRIIDDLIMIENSIFHKENIEGEFLETTYIQEHFLIEK